MIQIEGHGPVCDSLVSKNSKSVVNHQNIYIHTHTWLSGRENVTFSGVRYSCTLLKSQSLAANPPTRKTDYSVRSINMSIDYVENN